MSRLKHANAPKLAASLLLLCVAAIYVAAQDAPPKAPVREVKDTYFGQTIIDPYRWMEDAKSAETSAWMKAQADYARAYLDRLPLRGELLKRITEVSDTGVRVGGVQRRGERYFYYKRAPGENDRKLYVRDGLNGAERLLVDPEKMSKDGKHHSLMSYSPSRDGKYLSYLVSPGGSEFGEIRVLDVATGRETGDRIEATRWEAGSWTPDNRSFTYFYFQKLAPGVPATETYQKVRVHLHTLGTPVEKDKVLFGYGVNPNIKLEPTPIPWVYFPLGSKYAVTWVNSGVSPNSEYYIAPIDALNQTPIPWRKVVSLEDEVSNMEIRGDDLYLLTYKNTPRYKIIRMDTRFAANRVMHVMFPASEAVVENFAMARDALYVQTLDGGTRRLHRVDYNTRKAQAVKLPYDGSAYIASAEPDRDGILFTVNSWTNSPTLYNYDPARQTTTDMKLIPPIPIDMSGIESTTVKVKSHDGVMIPLVILHKRGLRRDGTNPTLLNGYGAYSIENTSPFFAASILPWLERGGVMALAGVRGGGEYGEEWHLAGKGATKPNTWKDFIAAAEYLVREKYTSPQHLAGQGGSAGGILIGNAIAERPDLFGAAIINVGVNNTLRAETTANGVPNIPEFGTHKTEEGFKALLAMDAYHKVKDGVKYPSVLLTHGINDPRVEPWMSAKMAARLQAATTSGNPILLRIEYDAGHGIGSTKKQRNEEQADVYAFLFQQLGGGGVSRASATSK